MRRSSDEFGIPVDVESAAWACREAVVDMGWEVDTLERDRLIIRRGLRGFSRDPATVEILLSDVAPGTTKIVLHGRLKWQRTTSHLDGELLRLRNAIEMAAHRVAAAP